MKIKYLDPRLRGDDESGINQRILNYLYADY